MKDQDKTKGQLINELLEMRKKIAEMKKSETESKRAEETLKVSETRYRRLFETAKDGILLLDADTGQITDVNPYLIEMLGYSHEQFLGKRLWDIGLFRDIAASRDSFQKLQGERYIRYEHLPLETKKGQYIDVEFVSNIYQVDHKSVIQCNIRNITERKQTNITEHKQAEEKMAALQEQFRQSQKIEALGSLAGGIAHDFNNLLTVIKGYSQLSLIELKEADPLKESIEEIQKATDRAAALTRQLLAFSRRQVMEMKVLDLNTILKDLEKMLRRVIGEDIKLVTLLAEDLGSVKTDPGQIEQVVVNLAVNSRDSMPNGGKLTIETANVELDEDYAHAHVAVTPGRYVMLSVSDTGVGMTREIRDRVFDPFLLLK